MRKSEVLSDVLIYSLSTGRKRIERDRVRTQSLLVLLTFSRFHFKVFCKWSFMSPPFPRERRILLTRK